MTSPTFNYENLRSGTDYHIQQNCQHQPEQAFVTVFIFAYFLQKYAATILWKLFELLLPQQQEILFITLHRQRGRFLYTNCELDPACLLTSVPRPNFIH